MAFNLWKAIALYYDAWYTLAGSVGFKGNLIPITAVTAVPDNPPPNNIGIQFYVDPTTHAVTVYVWDGSAWQTH